MKVQKDNDRRKGLVKCIGIIYICIIFYLTSIINITRRFHYFLVALFRSVGVELVIPGLVEDIIGVVFNVWICTTTPQLLKIVGLTKSSKGVFGRVPAAKEVATAVKETLASSATESKRGRAPGTKSKKKRKESYSIYIYKVLKQVHPDSGISSKAMSIMNSFVNDLFERIASEARQLAHYNKRHTISSSEIQTAVRLLLPGELAKHAVSEGMKAVNKYTSCK